MINTPGPWKIYDVDRQTMHIGTVSKRPKVVWDYVSICNMFEDSADNYETSEDNKLFENATANARLISAAPDLLEALQNALEVIENEGDTFWSEVANKARVAIAKAKGESS